MKDRTEDTWKSFLVELQDDILPIYFSHERSFDRYSIHGRVHICRCLIFAEVMGRYYYDYTDLQPDLSSVRYAVAFHDSGREGNGIDLWEEESSQMCFEYCITKAIPKDKARSISRLITKTGNDWSLEKRIVHDADVLDIMRPCCGHGGLDGFREHALRFLGLKDGKQYRNREIRDLLISEVWEFIKITEQAKQNLHFSNRYMEEVLKILQENHYQLSFLGSFLAKDFR